jgi:beta-lactamase regulating signal transducer with metallopeptidase domain
MNLLARFDFGDAVTGLVFMILVQTSVVIVLAALWSGTLLRRRAEGRHALWLGVLVLIVVSPAIAAVLRQSNFAFWSIALPVSGHRSWPTQENRQPRQYASRSDSSRLSGDSPTISVPANADPPPEPMAAMDAEPARFETPPAKTGVLSRGGSDLVRGLTLLWLAGAVIGFARIAVGWARTVALCRCVSAIDPVRHGPTLNRVRDALGMPALPPVFTSTAIEGPVVVGLVRPRVILPDGLAESLASDSLRDVLIHECAHIIRLDAWVGLLQRLAGVFFWPHPLVHYASGQLARAREEVCDNHVLRHGDRCDYARTLLALTERYLPLGAARPGLGLLGARWTLADRVAGLLDTRRFPMTRTTIRMKIAVWIALGVTTLAAFGVRLDGRAIAGPASDPDVDAQPAVASRPKNAVWSIEGTVVDEHGNPVSGAVVHSREEADPGGARSAADGAFTLWLNGRRLYVRALIAEADNGARIGLTRFSPARHLGANDPVRLVVKPTRPVKVRVKDVAGSPILGAAVEAFDYEFSFHALTDREGLANLHVPADAVIRGVVGLKSGAGFDYFENYRATPPSPEFPFPPLPGELALMLDGAQTLKIKALDPEGRPVSGVVLAPFRPMKAGKIASMPLYDGMTTSATTDAQGIAVFDWLPKEASREYPLRGLTFIVKSAAGFNSPGMIRYERGRPMELTMRLDASKSPRLGGTVRLPDGRPAGQVLLILRAATASSMPEAARTDDDGKYAFDDLRPDVPYMIAVHDKSWAAATRRTVVLKAGQDHGGVDFALTKGTLIHGRVTEEPDHRPAAGRTLALVEEGDPLPKDLRSLSNNKFRISRVSPIDGQGRYQFRVLPGLYRLSWSNQGNVESLDVEVKDESEIVRDVALKGPARETYFTGVVVEKTATGERPILRASVFRWPVRGLYKTDEQGRFQMERTGSDTVLYAFYADHSLAGFATISTGADTVKLVLTRTATITGRVIDSNGQPWARQRVRVELAHGNFEFAPAHFAVSAVMTDDQGRFTYQDAPVGSSGEIGAYHRKDNPPLLTSEARGPRSVVSFEVRDLDPIQVPDLVVPAVKAAN